MTAPAGFVIEPATLADAPAIAAILNHAIEHTTANWNDQPQSDARMTLWLQEKAAGEWPVLVARDAKRGPALGYATCGPFRTFPGYRFTVEDSVYVAPDAQRRGVGRALLGALIETARAAGLHAMVAGSDAENASSIALHSALGFTEVARMPEVGRKFDRWLTLVLMQRALD